MSVNDRLYRLTDRDLGQSQARAFQFNDSVTIASATPSAFVTIQSDRMLLVTSISVVMQPGAGQIALDWLASFLAPQPGGTFLFTGRICGRSNSNPVAARRFVDSFALNNELIIPPGWRFQVGYTFDAGGVANTVETNVAGILVPQGTLLFN